jgi:glycosyltransferase involved in cell wall biosynthesis
MKIIFVTREGYRLPGARIRCYNFAGELKKHGVDAEVLSFSDSLAAKDGEQESQLRIRDKLKYNWLAFKKLNREKEAILCIQRFNYHSLAPYLAHLLNKNRIILDLDDWEMREDPRYYLGVYPSSKAHFFTKHIASRSIFCMAASRFLEGLLLQFNPKVCYMPTGVDTEKFQPTTNIPSPEKLTFSWIGTFHRREYIANLEFAVRCFSVLRKKYRHIYFEIRGEGIYKDSLVRIINQYADSHILLKGWLDPDKIPEYLAGIHIGIMPVAYDNSFNRAKSPTKIFEYMAMAKPVVASSIGEVTRVIRDGDNGFLAETESEFTKKMQLFIEDNKLCRVLGEKARETVVNDYSLVIMGRRFHEMLKTI